jgi:hypothetical protein
MSDSSDPRWGGYVPWFLRHADISPGGNFPTFFSRLSQRLERLFKFNECQVQITHFGPMLESESLQVFGLSDRKMLDANIKDYFSPEALESAAMADALKDKEEKEAADAERTARQLKIMLNPPPSSLTSFRSVPGYELKDRAKAKRDLASWEGRANKLRGNANATREERKNKHYNTRIKERLTVLESLLQLLPKQTEWYDLLLRDIRRFLAESEIRLNIRVDGAVAPLIIPLDEPLLQSQVIDKLLPRLFERFPNRARELVGAYHQLLIGKDGDSIFIEAFKSLEQLARDMTDDQGFIFDKKHLDKHFSSLHGTIHQTLIRLDGHRGDKGGHGKDAPPSHEIRYLLLAICNAALLLLDYPRGSE